MTCEQSGRAIAVSRARLNPGAVSVCGHCHNRNAKWAVVVAQNTENTGMRAGLRPLTLAAVAVGHRGHGGRLGTGAWERKAGLHRQTATGLAVGTGAVASRWPRRWGSSETAAWGGRWAWYGTRHTSNGEDWATYSKWGKSRK